MIKHNRPPLFLHSTRAVLVAWLLLSAVNFRTQALQVPASTDTSSQLAKSAPVRIEDVVDIVGLENKPGAEGVLAFNEKAMTFDAGGHSTAIPLSSILAFSVVAGDKPLIRGTKGKIAEAAPYGIGFAVSMTRPAAEMLTFFYKDSYSAIHACILVLPKGTGESVISALAAKLSPTEYPKTGNLMSSVSEAQPGPGAQMAPVSGQSKPSIEVTLPAESVDGIPPAFPAAVYEDLIGQLTKTGLFAHVWRAGDVRRTSEALVLHVDLEDWKKGSARGRGLGPFTGATVLQSSVTLEDRSGRILFQETVKGKKRMKGESLDVTNGLAKRVRKELEKTPAVASNKQAGK